jgi:predicted  nucleic acid-binding Zn-ribbon protein
MSRTQPRGNPEERIRMIAESAYFRAEKRGFKEGRVIDDWIEAEAEIDRLLLESGHASERQALLRKIEKQLDNWDEKVTALKTLSGEAGTEISKELDLLAARRADLEARARELAQRSGEVWEDIKAGAEAAGSEMRKTFDKIARRLRQK